MVTAEPVELEKTFWNTDIVVRINEVIMNDTINFLREVFFMLSRFICLFIFYEKTAPVVRLQANYSTNDSFHSIKTSKSSTKQLSRQKIREQFSYL